MYCRWSLSNSAVLTITGGNKFKFEKKNGFANRTAFVASNHFKVIVYNLKARDPFTKIIAILVPLRLQIQ